MLKGGLILDPSARVERDGVSLDLLVDTGVWTCDVTLTYEGVSRSMVFSLPYVEVA